MMAISPELALLRQGEREPVDESAELVCSYDFNGNIIELNEAMERATGYSREETLNMNLSVLLGPDLWESTRRQILEQLGGGSARSLDLVVIRKDGRRVPIEMSRRLLFEAGRPVAVQDIGRAISSAVFPETQTPRSTGDAHLPAKPDELARFADHLKQLHRLSTSLYKSLDDAFEDHLKTGCRLFGLPIGIILHVEGATGVVRAAYGREGLDAGSKLPLESTHCFTVANRLRTLTSSESVPSDRLLRDFEIYIGTPILVESELFGTLSFSSSFDGAGRIFSAAEKELIELMARSIGRFVLEHRIRSERERSEHLERSRNRVLEMMAENRKLESTLRQVVRMVEGQRAESMCSVLLLRDGMLQWHSAPSFPPDAVRLFKPVRLTRDSGDSIAAELARWTVYWDDVRQCPIWAERAHFAAQIGIESCLTTPILSSKGTLLGMIALHYRGGQSKPESDRDLLQLASRLTAVAIEQRRLHDRLESRARHDSLTGLPNRSYFIELLEAALNTAREGSATLAVLFIDLDRFKQINDTLGHDMGDRVLKEVGERLRRLLTEDDLAGRMGGDEFTIVLARQPDEQTAIQASQEFLNAFRAPHRIDGHELFVTASIGVAVFPKHGATTAELLHNADLAMYHAKNSGKNDVEIFISEDHAAGLERLRLENALRRALEHHEFDLLYQPVVNMNGKVESFEALLTWRHPVYGTISPTQFIPIAEETGLIIEIGSWVIRQACAQGARWHNAGHLAPRVSVNVSALQFERRDFIETVKAALETTGFPAKCLELELTESYVMKDLAQAAPRMARIRDLGVTIAIDDFGTGYSSLSYLNKLPVDSLKIDQSFLRSLQEPEGSLPVVQGIVRLAHSLNLTVVAEGVETASELELVRMLGCDKVQGHIYGPPLRHEAVEALFVGRTSACDGLQAAAASGLKPVRKS